MESTLLNTGSVLLAASVISAIVALVQNRPFVQANIASHRSTLLIFSLQCLVPSWLNRFRGARLTSGWQWFLLATAVYAYISTISHQLRKIARFPKSEKPGLFAKQIHPKYIFRVFLWAAVYPLVLDLLWSPRISQLATALFALAMVSLFGAWLFMDNERSLRESISSDLFKSWLAICTGFALLSACLELISSNSHWYLYGLSVCAFAGSSRMAISIWQKENLTGAQHSASIGFS